MGELPQTGGGKKGEDESTSKVPRKYRTEMPTGVMNPPVPLDFRSYSVPLRSTFTLFSVLQHCCSETGCSLFIFLHVLCRT